MNKHLHSLLSGELLDDDIELTLGELCRASSMSAERLLELVDQGVLDPIGNDPARWRFRALSVRRVWCVQRLERDLGVNLAGAALALELLEEVIELRNRLRRFER